jgi:hypothetical protein
MIAGDRRGVPMKPFERSILAQISVFEPESFCAVSDVCVLLESALAIFRPSVRSQAGFRRSKYPLKPSMQSMSIEASKKVSSMVSTDNLHQAYILSRELRNNFFRCDCNWLGNFRRLGRKGAL